MLRTISTQRGVSARPALDLARVLLVHGDLPSRLALQTILQAGGYFVDVAATPSEALTKLDAMEYDLVLTDSQIGSSATSRNVLAYARVKQYRPATALVTSYDAPRRRRSGRDQHRMSICTDNLPNLLGKVADLIGIRAIRKYRPLSHAAV